MSEPRPYRRLREAAGQCDVFISPSLLAPFFEDAARQYNMAWASARDADKEPYLPRCWALLVGEIRQDALVVRELCWAKSVRETDADVVEEFTDVIAPCFGSAYKSGRRGYWCDPAELLRITREAAEQGMDVLGSIHMHADMHRFWPDHAKGQLLSECPTAMDTYLFRNGGWPLNIICHLEGLRGEIVPRLGAWAPPAFADEDAPAQEMAVHFTMGPLSLAS
ncbi:hypothetical protein [Streptomyces sp. NPDC050528]|uniref:hypothetical protein n=1 Tax=Streptomyces sp. NPDC050528 TaxID=3365623 RepID=UPI0037A4DE2F